MKKLSRKIFNESILHSDKDTVKALCLLLYVKNKYSSSLVHNFSYHKLAKLTGTHQNTIKKRIIKLNEMGLTEYIHSKKGNKKHLLLKSVRAKYSNINIEKIDYTSLKTIEISLLSYYIKEVQNRKDFINHQILKGSNPKHKLNKKQYRVWKGSYNYIKRRGFKEYNENGISYTKISKVLKIGLNKVSLIIKKGVQLGLFIKNRNIQQVYVKNKAKEYFYSLGIIGFFTKNNVYIVKANTYTLLGE